jgi:hypothetical protein
MPGAFEQDRQQYRVWVARYDAWRPQRWDEIPPRCWAVEAAEPGCMSHASAVQFIEGFNSAVLNADCRLWAVAVPVAVFYAGDAVPGEQLRSDSPRLQSVELPELTAAPAHVQGVCQSPQRSR